MFNGIEARTVLTKKMYLLKWINVINHFKTKNTF